jgi:hypothetical protein
MKNYISRTKKCLAEENLEGACESQQKLTDFVKKILNNM